jgi:hypothetical protein
MFLRLTDDQRQEYAQIFLWRARFLFGVMLHDIMAKADISQREIARRSKEYKKQLIENKLNYPRNGVTAVDQSALSRLISTDRPPSYGQVYIFLIVLEGILKEKGFSFSQELRDDLWRLALFGPPEMVYQAYQRHKDMIDEESPEFIEALEEHKRKMEGK